MSSSSIPSGQYLYTDTLKGVYFGPGSVEYALPKLLKELGVTKALIVTGTSLQTKTDIVERVEAILRQHQAHGGVFSDIGQHAPIAGIKAGQKAFKDGKCDIIVSVGGGSPIDAAKAMLYYLQQESGAESPMKQIAIPTTLSAAEYTVGAGFTSEKGDKIGVSSQQLAPSGIILDCDLTSSTPERLWLSTGIRALDHAVENLYRPLVPPPIKVLCYAAIADLFKYLPISKADPEDMEARQKLQLAAWMSLWPLKLEKHSALGLSHALGHKLGATYGIPHGITSCITLAPVVALKSEIASAEDKQSLADALFYLRTPSTGSIDGDAKKLAELIDKLVVDLGLHSTLSEYKVPKSDIDSIAEKVTTGKDDPTYSKIVALLEAKY